MSDKSAGEQWGKGDSYEPYVGRWSRLVAARFIEWLAPAPERRWLDVGCGTGALTGTILDAARPTSVHGVDPSEDYVRLARDRIADPKAEFEVADAYHLPGDGGTYDNTVSGLVLNFIPDPAEGMDEMKRVTRAGGVIAAYVWDYADGMELMRYFWDAAAERDRNVGSIDEGVRFPICKPKPLHSLWEEAGLHEVTTVPIDIETVFRDLDDYWSPFLGGQGPAPSYTMSLGDSARDELRTLLRKRLPIKGDGSIHLRARAWGVRGTMV